MKNLQNLEEYHIQTQTFMKRTQKNTVFVLLKPNNQRRGSEHQTSSNRPAGKLEGKFKTREDPLIHGGRSSEYNQNCTGNLFLACLLVFSKYKGIKLIIFVFL